MTTTTTHTLTDEIPTFSAHRVRTAPHITGEDADAGVVYLTRADFEAAQAEGREVAVAWDSGVKTWTPARDLVVE